MNQTEIISQGFQAVADAIQHIFIIDLMQMYVNDEIEGSPEEVLQKLNLKNKCINVLSDSFEGEYKGEEKEEFDTFLRAMVDEVYNGFVQRAEWKQYIEQIDQNVLRMLGGQKGEC